MLARVAISRPLAPLNLQLLSAFALFVIPAVGAAQAPSPRAGPTPCTTAEFHQFDFWLGRWQVTGPKGKTVGHSFIERLPDGCVLQEHWTSATGGHGASMNFYDRTTGKWNQVWVDGLGGVLRLTGGRQGEAMVLSGMAPGPAGLPQHQRITWTPLGGGTVRQLWETSDDGATWQVSFDGTYAVEGG